MSTRLTVNQLEQMKTHELADLLANVVLLLRRMPDVACSQLVQQLPSYDDVQALPPHPQRITPMVIMSKENLQKKTVPELRKLASELSLPLFSKMKKDELVSKILARSTDQHSEQFAIHSV